MIQGLSHMTFIVSDLDRSEYFFTNVFQAQKIYESHDDTFSISRERFFIVGDHWIVIMEGNSLAERTYNHVAFHVKPCDFEYYVRRVEKLGLRILPGRTRVEGEGRSIYFYDYDNHLFEIHDGTLEMRLDRYNRKES